MTHLAIISVIFVSVTAAAMIVLTQFMPSRTRRRVDAMAENAAYGQRQGDQSWIATVIKLAGPFARLSVPKEGWETSPLRVRFMNAGYRNESAVLLYFAAKTLLAVGLPTVLFLALRLSGSNLQMNMMLAVLLLVATFGYYLPNVVLARMVSLRRREIFESFPDAADLMLVCVESGLGLDAALNKVAEEMRLNSEALAEELHIMNLEMRAGVTREKALRNLALRTGVEEVNTFATMLVQADRFGTSIGDSLRVFSDELRTRRQMRAEELAAKIPLKLLFPLVFCIFPALLLVLLGPAFIQIYRILLPAMGGTQ
ncbi:MAG: type II secretion system F family protein [Burkholderiales bacterium]